MKPSKRLGRTAVASIVGTIIFVLVMVLALGSQVYLTGLQAQSSRDYQQALSVADHRVDELLTYSGPSSVLAVVNGGPTTSRIVGMFIRYPNGSVYSGASFSSRTLPASAGAAVQGLVPSGICLPSGTATCSSRYATAVGSSTPGYSVGLLTSLGNTFWYVPAGGVSNLQGSNSYHTTAAQSTTSTTFVPIQGLAFSGNANGYYTVQLYIAYTHSNSGTPGMAFAISVPAGASFLFCGGFFWSDASASTTDKAPGNMCNSAPGVSLGPIQPQAGQAGSLCTTAPSGCEFVGTAFVSFGSTPGQFQVEFKGSSSDTASVVADSTIVVSG